MIKLTISHIIISALLVVVLIVGYFFTKAAIMTNEASIALDNRCGHTTESILGTITVTYDESDPYRRVATAILGNKKISKTDFNKSRMLGRWTARKGRQFIAGIKEELKNED